MDEKMTASIDTAKKIIKLLKEITTLSVVSDFLKSKGLASSASSWHELEKIRLIPAIEKGELTTADLKWLLSSSEEHGRQHVFLYKTSENKAKELSDEARIREKLASTNDEIVIDEPRLLEEPEVMRISEVRLDQGSVLIKYIETKISMKPLDTIQNGDILTKTYTIHKERAVNLIKLHSDGLLEIRIGSHRSAGGYKKDLERFIGIADDFFPHKHFRMLSLSKLKTNLWEKREELEEKIRFTNWTLKNDYGNSLHASSASIKDGLSSDEGLQSSLETFIDAEAYCDSTNIYFLEGEDGLPSAEVHVLLTGEANEFAITKHCDEDDYEYVLSEIRRLNN